MVSAPDAASCAVSVVRCVPKVPKKNFKSTASTALSFLTEMQRYSVSPAAASVLSTLSKPITLLSTSVSVSVAVPVRLSAVERVTRTNFEEVVPSSRIFVSPFAIVTAGPCEPPGAVNASEVVSVAMIDADPVSQFPDTKSTAIPVCKLAAETPIKSARDADRNFPSDASGSVCAAPSEAAPVRYERIASGPVFSSAILLPFRCYDDPK